jgi:arginine decarboxylase
MNNTYFDLVDQTYNFPQEGFDLNPKNNSLLFNELPILELVEKYGTPLKISYLPKISEQINKAYDWFENAIRKHNYQGKYYYTYCSKSSHFKFVLNEVLKNITQIETSSSFDIDLVWKLYYTGKINKNALVVNNGFKPRDYAEKIAGLINEGFKNVIPVLDNKRELEYYQKFVKKDNMNIGLRVATEEEPNFEFYTSRLGIRSASLIDFYKDKIEHNPKFTLKMLHFFVDTGIKDNLYYWSELKKGIKMYCELRKICPTLSAINIGGGMPIRNSLSFEYDYEYMVDEIVRLIKDGCTQENVPEPDIFTEFGKFTVGESAATIFSIIGQKRQNDSELWYMIDNSIMTTLPDAWGIGERFILLPINHWDKEYQRVNIGGISCDNSDYYNAEVHMNQVFLPKIDTNSDDETPLYLGFFHTGAYQDSISGYGGIKHCLIPTPKHILVEKNVRGEFVDWMVTPEQTAESMLKILGY